MRLLALLLSAISLQGQTVANGLIYQAAIAHGITYIDPDAGTQVLNQKAGLNWKSLFNSFIGTGSGAALEGGLTKIVSMSPQVLVGIATFHLIWDAWLSKTLTLAEPNTSAVLAKLLDPEKASIVTSLCVRGTLFAVYNRNLKAVPDVLVAGTIVSFSPQGAAVLVNAAGTRIKSFAVVSVLACPATTTSIAALDSIQLDKEYNVIGLETSKLVTQDINELIGYTQGWPLGSIKVVDDTN